MAGTEHRHAATCLFSLPPVPNVVVIHTAYCALLDVPHRYNFTTVFPYCHSMGDACFSKACLFAMSHMPTVFIAVRARVNATMAHVSRARACILWQTRPLIRRARHNAGAKKFARKSNAGDPQRGRTGMLRAAVRRSGCRVFHWSRLHH